MAEQLPAFVHTLPSLDEPAEPVELPREVLAGIDRRCAELQQHRAQAAVSGQSYLILGGGS